jgi:Tfp pilus assembly protein PilX
MTDRLRRRLRHLAMSERGFALPTALLATVISFSLASAAVVASVTSQRGTARDHNSKEAIAAADSGANVALMRLNRYTNALSSSTPCLGVSGSTLFATGVSGDGWCPAISGSVGGSTYSYRVTPQVSGATMNVVSTGASESVSRRVDVSLKGTTVGSAFGAEGLIGQDGITLSGNADIRVGIGTNGNVASNGNASVCGNIRHGVGKEWSHSGNASQCNGYSVTEGNVSLPPVSSFMPAGIATSNYDYRLVTCTKTKPVAEPAGCQSDTYSGTWSTNSPWNPSTRTLSAAGNSILTLGGGDYWFCKIALSGNSELIMAAGAHVRIFFDTPENCGMSAGSSQIELSGNNRIAATGYQPTLGQFDVPGFYLLGSPTIPTSVNLSGNNVNEFVIYGPNTNISLSGNAVTFKGAVAGKTISMSGNGQVVQDAGFEPPKIGGATVYSRQSYVECTGGTASPPSANC